MLVILLCWYKRYSVYLISFFNVDVLFPAFICANYVGLFPAFVCANNIGSLVSNLIGAKTFNYLPSSGGIPGISINSSESSSFSWVEGEDVSNKSLKSSFCLLSFTLSAIISSGYDLLFPRPSTFLSINFWLLISKLLGLYLLPTFSFSSSVISL